MSSVERAIQSVSDGGKALRPRVLPWVVLACTLLSTFAVAYYIWSKDRLRSDSAAREAAEQARQQIQSRVSSYVALMRAAAAMVSNRLPQGATEIPKYQGEFINYVDSLGLGENYPGFRGIGFSLRLRPDERAEFEVAMRDAGTPNYRVWTDIPGKTVGQEEMFPIVYSAPVMKPSISAMGFDPFSDPDRRGSMLRARDTAGPAATGLVTLKQRNTNETLMGIVFYLPVYHTGVAPRDQKGRETELGGFVQGGFRAGDLLDQVFSTSRPPINLSVFDGNTLLDRTDSETAPAVDAGFDDAPAGVDRTLHVAGRRWTLRFRTHPRPELSLAGVVVPGVLTVGGLLSLALFLLTHSEGRARLRAENAAHELRKSREALEEAIASVRKSEDQLRLITDSLPVLVSYVDADEKYRFMNRHYVQWFGVPENSLVGKSVREVLGEEYYPGRQPHIAEAMQGRVVRYVGLTPHQDGTARETEMTYVPDRAADGTVRGFVSLVADVTDQRRTEQALRRYADLFQHAELGLVVTGAEGITLEMDNPAFARLCGYAPGELTGHAVLDVFAPEYRTEVPSHVKIARERGHHTFESTFQRRDGSRFPVELDVTAVKGPTGLVVYYILSATDITDRERTEAELRYQLHLTNTISANAADSLFTLDALGRITFMNPAAEARFGWTSDEALGKSLHEVVSPHDSENGGSLEKVFRTGQTLRDHEDVFVCRDGTRVNVLCTSAPIITSELITGAVLVVHDITDRKRAEQEREQLLAAEQAARADAEQLARQAAAANRSKDEFLATLSHELRTPLNAMLGWAQLLRMGGMGPDEFGQGLETIERNARMQAQLVEDLLDLSRIISGKLRLEIGNVDMPAVIEAALDSVRPAAEAKSIRIVPVIDSHAGMIRGDANRLQQVVWNLLSNAIKFTPRNGQVQITLVSSGGQAEVSVSDNGEGIDPEFLPHVFDRLRQADASTTRKHGGLGLGLSIARHLVELHGGTAQAFSAGKGRGATFTVLLPVSLRQQDEPARSERVSGSRLNAQPGPLPSLAGVEALVVDDELDARDLIARILRQCGARVTVAASVREAMALIAAQTPDVLLSDIGMPGEDGYALIRQLRSLPQAHGGRIPAIALTAFARNEDRQRALDEGFQMHIAKPVEPAELTAAVAELISCQESDVVTTPQAEYRG